MRNALQFSKEIFMIGFPTHETNKQWGLQNSRNVNLGMC